MNRRIRMAASMAAWLAMTVVGAAEPASPKADAKPAAAEGRSQDQASAKAADSKAGDKKKDKECVVTTGSRIRRDPARACAPGEHAYTPEDIAATGEMNLSEALRKLDPRFQ